MKRYIAIDIGGTGIKYGVVRENGDVEFVRDTPTEAHKGGRVLLDKVRGLIREILFTDSDVDGIGISSAGVIDNVGGSVIYASENIPGWTGMEIKKELAEEFSVEVAVENDVNAYALGEVWMGAGRGYENLLCITLGTGIGAGIIINGKLYRGKNKRAGEIGYLQEIDNTVSYEKKASTKCLLKKASEILGREINGKEFFDLVKNGNNRMAKIYDSWSFEVAKGIGDLIYVLDPELIIIGGGISKQGSYLKETLTSKIKENMREGFTTTIEVSKLCEAANLLGAVFPFLNK